MPEIPVAGRASNETPKNERKYVRSMFDGQLGWLEKVEGKLMVRLDRPAEKIYRPYSADHWAAESQDRPLARMQLARIAYEADRALRLASGEFAASVKDWLSLRDEDRADFAADGPPDGRRRILYDAIIKALT